jgi:GTP-binding protein
MPQTRFVLKHALSKKLKIIVVVNKIDRPDARIHEVLDKTLDLFIELGADDDTADFPIVYASAKEGKAGLETELNNMTDIFPIFEAILKHVPQPLGDPEKPLQMLMTTLSRDDHKGRIATGRIYNGTAVAGQDVMHINRSGEMKKYRLTSLMTFVGLERTDIKEAKAGDIVAISGIPDITIGETIASVEDPTALPLLAIEEPTVRMVFRVNDSPFAGKEGEFKTSRQIQERLHKELETDTALRVEDMPDGRWMVSGRGELHLAILIERLRREGYEFQVGRPQVITKVVDGKKLAPFERVFIETPQDYSGIVMQKMGARKAQLEDMTTDENNIVYMQFIIPTSAFFGYRSEFITDTRGLGIINTTFYKYDEDSGEPMKREHGSLVSHETGASNLYGLLNAQERGTLFIGSAVSVYKGQVIGENARSEDMSVNVCKAKQLSNMRSKGDGKADHFDAPRIMTLEDALEYIGDDELVEVTPKSVRMRKIILDEMEAKRQRAQGN